MQIGPKLVARQTLKQTLTPGLVQMVNLLTLNKVELQEAIAEELLSNPLLEESQDAEPAGDESADPGARDALLEAEARLRLETPADLAVTEAAGASGEESDLAESPDAAALASPASPAGQEESDAVAEAGDLSRAADAFEEIDFGDFFEKYLDPGFQIGDSEEIERPAFENFISAPTTLTDHLLWQLSVAIVDSGVRESAEAIIGNLDEDGYLTAEDQQGRRFLSLEELADAEQVTVESLRQGLELVQSFDPTGVACRDLRECLLLQLRDAHTPDPLAERIVSDFLPALQNQDWKAISRATLATPEQVAAAVAAIRRLDPHPGRRYNQSQPRLIEPDVFFVKGRPARCSICDREECENTYRILLNDDGLPQLTLNRGYRAMKWDKSQREVSHYIRERYSSALQFLKNLEQRKFTILRVCHAIIARQGGFLDAGLDYLRPLMIKDVAEEIGVHPSTVSRAVANKYAHTPQGVLELRYFFSEAVQGSRGGETSLLNLKRRVKAIITGENPRQPLTDDRIAAQLRQEGIEVTRRTVAKYREDLHIPSTHRRRQKD